MLILIPSVTFGVEVQVVNPAVTMVALDKTRMILLIGQPFQEVDRFCSVQFVKKQDFQNINHYIVLQGNNISFTHNLFKINIDALKLHGSCIQLNMRKTL